MPGTAKCPRSAATGSCCLCESVGGADTGFFVTVGFPIGQTSLGGSCAEDAAPGAIHDACSGALLPDPRAGVQTRSAQRASPSMTVPAFRSQDEKQVLEDVRGIIAEQLGKDLKVVSMPAPSVM